MYAVDENDLGMVVADLRRKGIGKPFEPRIGAVRQVDDRDVGAHDLRYTRQPP